MILSIIINPLCAHDIADVDSLKNKPDNLAVKMITVWQKISFKTSLLNCQFEPCCSDYSIMAIQQKGTVRGILLGADRVARCHPAAYKYYHRNQNGQLSDPVTTNSFRVNRNLYSRATVGISVVLPGTHKMLHHRFYDGLSTLLIVGLAGCGGYKYENMNNMFYVPLYALGMTFYLSDIYTNFSSIIK